MLCCSCVASVLAPFSFLLLVPWRTLIKNGSALLCFVFCVLCFVFCVLCFVAQYDNLSEQESIERTVLPLIFVCGHINNVFLVSCCFIFCDCISVLFVLLISV